ncbi:hypothetical protein, unlikely [Trypanosoma brucei brucei TREU927]|uniref:Uncharacterized protein n=1 Tax=Trypanosoma brucei brucei (strain 927/4 GUTat10.1) TaxID=185431 RepID=Q38FQ4_TRYB2|nr:hypothetical protein, unlikely [Trypanosoma brucei brucei TREU927]EAN76366.1 hypothetical protein, unlikely [Trypanosoma brucei brucei TREU927]
MYIWSYLQRGNEEGKQIIHLTGNRNITYFVLVMTPAHTHPLPSPTVKRGLTKKNPRNKTPTEIRRTGGKAKENSYAYMRTSMSGLGTSPLVEITTRIENNARSSFPPPQSLMLRGVQHHARRYERSGCGLINTP